MVRSERKKLHAWKGEYIGLSDRGNGRCGPFVADPRNGRVAAIAADFEMHTGSADRRKDGRHTWTDGRETGRHGI